MTDCNCKPTPPRRDSHAVEMAKYSAERVAARIDTPTAKALVKYCAANGCTTSSALRSAIMKLSDRSPDAELADLIRVLGLDADATPDAILDAVNALLNAGDPPEASGPTGEAPDAPPPKPLTKLERDYIAREKITPAAFAARKAGAAHRVMTSKERARK